jgi:hypothetical protein
MENTDADLHQGNTIIKDRDEEMMNIEERKITQEDNDEMELEGLDLQSIGFFFFPQKISRYIYII